MLNLLRRGIKTWVAKVLFGLLVVSFAIWGIGDVFNFGIGSSVATVGEQKIPAERYANALNREVRAASQRFGQPLDAETTRALGLPQQVLGRLAQEATFDEAMNELGVSAPDSAVSEVITSDPSFKGANGAFDQEAYRYALAQNGFTVESYEDIARRTIARRQLILALTSGVTAPEGAVETIYAFQTETRRFDLITLDASFAGEIGAPDEETLQTYHAEHADEFTTPERRDAIYLNLSLEALGEGFEPDEDALRDAYARHAGDYEQPERRTLHQIIYDTKADADAAVARVASGETTFDELLAKRGESRADTALGAVTEDELAPATGEAAFALESPGIAGPVDTGFGFALIDVSEITPAAKTTFEEARPDLVAELRYEHALDRAPEVAGEVEDRRAGGATLAEIATEMNLPLGHATGVAANGDGAFGFAASPEFLTELFAAAEGEERDMVETEAGSYFVLQIEAITPAALRPLDEIRDDVVASWRRVETGEALKARAEAIVDRIDAGETIEAIATELGVELTNEGPNTRAAGWSATPAALVEELFALPLGGAAFASMGDTVVIGAVAEIAAGEDNAQNGAMRDSLKQQMDQMATADALGLYLTAKQREIGVSVNQQVIDSMVTQISGH
ncbi:hypothetical protein G5B40_00385 [Pikeienuella piscinae]|uniref:Parvulin-like PPIase n=1 Tax=Pikeienuella piscinae TaxID=2748098 RepID=A0A7L5BSE4_9RHOB|nr:peptidylprolyl isomerase [Pikeienuella piscinae]QIE54030.1 hypothetical protein G5B40_00385 [Pikeienuella piscinae]